MISIILPNYNGEKYLSACLDSIFSQDYPHYEVILVDNASTDQSVALVRTRYPAVNIIENSVNRGYAGGGNDGVRTATGEYLLFLNTDTVLSRNFLSVLHSSALLHPEYGMYAPRVLYPDGSLQAAGSDASFSGSSWERGKGSVDLSDYNVAGEVFSPYGAAIFVSRGLIETTGGFDDDFFLFVEETDLAFRARLAGYRCWYEPEAVVIHIHGATAGRVSDVALYYLHRNTLWHVFKNYPLSLLFLSFPLIMGRNVLAILYYLIKGRGSLVLRAKWDALWGLPVILRKRKELYHSSGKIRLCLRLCHLG